MPKITNIIKNNRKRNAYDIYTDGNYLTTISENTLVKNQISKNKLINSDQIMELYKDEEFFKNYNIALKYISYGLKTVQELKKHLIKSNVSNENIKLIIRKLKEKQLLNDLEYAKSYVRTAYKLYDKGPLKISEYLSKKGINKTYIDIALNEFTQNMQKEKISDIISKHIKHYDMESFNNKIIKLKKILINKGFNINIINEVINNLNLKKNNENEFKNLNIYGNKLLKKYNKYSEGKRLNKIKTTLYNKGFQIEDILSFIKNKKL